MTRAIEIEIDTKDPPNGNVLFYPADKLVRGRFLHARESEPSARMFAPRWGDAGIPGQIVGIDLDAREGYVREPLHDEAHRELAERIKHRGLALPPAREAFKLATADDVATWLHWMRRHVDGGRATLRSGTFPAELPGTPRTRFGFGGRPDEREAERDTIKKLVAVLYAKLSAEERKAVEAVLS